MHERARRILRTVGFGAAILATAFVAVLQCASAQVNGRIVARGEVRDADTGARLDGVELRIRRSAFSLIGRDFARTSHETRPVDGRFDVACSPCANLILSFQRSGYHPRRMQIGLDPSDEGAKRRIEDTLVVELRREGEIVALERYSGALEHGAGFENVLPVGLGPTVHALPLAHVAERAKAIGRPEALAHVALVVETDDAGRPVEAPNRRGLAKPRSSHLDFAPAGGGAIAYAPRARDMNEIALEMREAPASGYAPTLLLDPDDDEVQYFYVKIGERYGRGQVTPVAIERTSRGRHAAAHVRLVLSPEPGSRNLETR